MGVAVSSPRPEQEKDMSKILAVMISMTAIVTVAVVVLFA
jgi:hypothetical protein